MPEEAPKTFPHYPPGTIHVPTVKEMGQLTKVLGARLSAMHRMPKSRGKGLQADQKVHIRKRKTKFY